MRVALDTIDRGAFAPYGQLLDAPGDAFRKDFAADLQNRRPTSARPNLALVRAQPANFPLEIRQLERHLHSSQAFMPLDVAEYMVLVCEGDGDGKPDFGTLRGFRVPGSVGLNYNPGIWHYGITTIGRPGTFAMFVFEDGSNEDCHFRDIAPLVVRA